MSPRTSRWPLWLALLAPITGSAQTQYNFGNPTADEQLYIELINRARANPAAEGARLASITDPDILSAYSYYGVDLALMQRELSAVAATPPLAPNALLTSAARGHSDWMLANATQSHNEGSVTTEQRITAAGYKWFAYGENVYATATSVAYGHAGFEIDWGSGGTGGMQTGRGHRASIHNSRYREIGVGVTFGSNGAVGPSLVTQDFGQLQTPSMLGTGVAYYDLNGNNFYDIGEGIAGLTVNIDGGSYFTQTAVGGGWAMPIPSATATRNVTFSGLLVNQTSPISITNPNNAKLDLKLAYRAPIISSPATAVVNRPYTFAFSGIGGAASYNWKRWTAAAAPAENAENSSNITSSTLGTYSILNTNVKQQGSSSFHLTEGATARTQWIQLSSLYRGLDAAALSFQSRVGISTSSEQYKVQVKEEGTSTWLDVYSQNGGGTNETGFSLRNASLSSMTNKLFRVRFLLRYSNGSWYPNSGDTYGWFIDAIQFSNVQQLQNEVTTNLTAVQGSFTPTTSGTYVQALFPVISGIDFPPAIQVLTVSASAPSGFSSWAQSYETANSLPAGTLSAANGDYDHDGQVNLLEYAFGTSPVLANETRPRVPKVSRTPTALLVDYQVDTSLSDLAVTPQATNSLANWKSPGQSGAPTNFTDQVISTSGTIQSRRATLPLASGAKGFIRVSVTQSP